MKNYASEFWYALAPCVTQYTFKRRVLIKNSMLSDIKAGAFKGVEVGRDIWLQQLPSLTTIQSGAFAGASIGLSLYVLSLFLPQRPVHVCTCICVCTCVSCVYDLCVCMHGWACAYVWSVAVHRRCVRMCIIMAPPLDMTYL